MHPARGRTVPALTPFDRAVNFGEYGAVQERDELLACFDITASTVFSWLCRLMAGDFARAAAALSATYADLATGTREPRPISEIECLAAGYSRALASSTTLPEGDAPSLSIQDRALLDLRVVQRREADVVAQIIGMTADEVPDAVARAVRAATGAGFGSSVAETLRRSDHWLDDVTRAKARAALLSDSSTGQASQRSATPAADDGSGPKSRRRQIEAWATVSVLLVVVLVTWVLPSSKSAPATTATGNSSSATPSGIGALAGDSATPGYIATDLPDGFIAAGASNTGGGISGESSVGVFELWAEPAASRTSGRWFAAVSSTGGLSMNLQSNTASRIEINGMPGLYTESADGVGEIVAERPGQLNAVDIVGHGFTRDELQTIANSLGRVSPSSPTDALLHFGPTFDPSAIGLTRVISTHTWSSSIRNQPVPAVEQEATYRNATFGTSFTVRTIPRAVSSEAVPVLMADQFLFEAPAEPFVPAEPDRTTLIGGQLVVVRSSTFTRLDGEVVTFNIVEWQDVNGTDVTLAGNLPKETLFKIGQTARLASANEWTQLASRSRDNFSVGITPSSPDVNDSVYLPISSPTTNDGETWIGAISADFTSIRLDHGGSSARSQVVPFVADSLRPVHVYNTIQSTAVVVVVRYGIAYSARFTVAGLTPITFPLSQLHPNVALAPALVGTMFAYSEPASLTVELLDANGAVLSTQQGG